jgi:hypothetical protein
MRVSPSTRTEVCRDGSSAEVATLVRPWTSPSPERLFVSLGLCFGILFAFVTPPLQIADEDSHFKKAYAVARGDLLQQAVVDGTGAHFGNRLPRAVVQFVERHRYMIGRTDAKYRYSDLYFGTAMSVSYGDRVFDSHSAGTLNALVYLPPALGMAAALLYTLAGVRNLYTPAAHLYFGRLFNLFFFVACVYGAVRLTPNRKERLPRGRAPSHADSPRGGSEPGRGGHLGCVPVDRVRPPPRPPRGAPPYWIEEDGSGVCPHYTSTTRTTPDTSTRSRAPAHLSSRRASRSPASGSRWRPARGVGTT